MHPAVIWLKNSIIESTVLLRSDIAIQLKKTLSSLVINTLGVNTVNAKDKFQPFTLLHFEINSRQFPIHLLLQTPLSPKFD